MSEVACNEEECPFAAAAKDKQTKAADLGWRCVLAFVSWIILGAGIVQGNGFFVSLVLFTIPLLKEYFSFAPQTTMRKIIKRIGIIASGFWVLVGFFGLSGILTVISGKDGLYIRVSENFIDYKGQLFDLRIIWYTIAINVALTVVDWIVKVDCLEEQYIRKDEKQNSKSTRDKEKEVLT